MGLKHIVGLTKEREVYVGGMNDEQQFGSFFKAKNSSFHLTMLKVPKLKKAKRVVCGKSNTVCLSLEGEVFVWGKGIHNQVDSGSDFLLPIENLTSLSIFVSKLFPGPETVLALVDKKDSSSICYTHFHPLTVQCATPPALFDCVFGKEHENTKKYERILLLTWPKWTNPEELVEYIRHKFAFFF